MTIDPKLLEATSELLAVAAQIKAEGKKPPAGSTQIIENAHTFTVEELRAFRAGLEARNDQH